MGPALLALVLSSGSPPPTGRLTVLVTLDARTVPAHLDLLEVSRQIRTIWTPYVDIDVVDAGAPLRRAYDERVSLVMAGSAREPARSHDALGWTTFPAPGQPDDFVTVSIDTARRLLTEGRWRGQRIAELPPLGRERFLALTVGRGAAHEIGHYLLRSSQHAASGLMQPQLTIADIMEDDSRRFRLLPHEVETLRRRAALEGQLADREPIPPNSE